jgi:hypothetical protein
MIDPSLSSSHVRITIELPAYEPLMPKRLLPTVLSLLVP